MRKMFSEKQIEEIVLAQTQEQASAISIEKINELAVRKMSAPESTTLTDEQIEKIIDGIFIEGEFLNLKNPVLFPASIFSDDYYGLVIGQFGDYGNTRITHYRIHHTSKVISIYDSTGMTVSYNGVILGLNGKSIPTYPANTGTFVLKCVDGTLTWVEEV